MVDVRKLNSLEQPAKSPHVTFKREASPSAQKSRIAALYRDYVGELSDGIRGRYGDGPPDPDEVAQEAFRKVCERDDITAIKNLRAFLWRTARNLIFDSKRMDESRSKYDFEIEQLFFPIKCNTQTPEDIMLAKEQLASVNKMLRRMPKKRRWALLLYRIDGLTLKEVGARLGISRTAVSKHISKAEMQINMFFLEQYGDD